MEQHIGVVYSIPCHDCPKTYTGQSGQLLECRIKEHQRAVGNGDTNTWAMAEHAWQEQHNITWPAATILDSSQYLNSRLILEQWHIHQQPHPMNRERGYLPSAYCSLIRNKNKERQQSLFALLVLFIYPISVCQFHPLIYACHTHAHSTHCHNLSPNINFNFIIFSFVP